MKILKQSLLLFLVVQTLVSCFGDKKSAVGQDFNTDDFVNKKFKGNKLSFNSLQDDLCGYIDTSIIMKEMKAAEVTEVIIDANKNRFIGKNCNFSVIFDNTPSKYSRGFLTVVENVEENETDWKEGWEFRKKSLKSAEYIPNLGKAAIWIGKQRKLEVKMDGYTITFNIPITYDKSFDYKSSAINIIKRSKFF